MPKLAKDPKRYCQNCGALLHRKRFNGRVEDMGVFRRRKFCDLACFGEAIRQKKVGHSALLWRARRHRKALCESCGVQSKPGNLLHVHHKDRNPANNKPSNLKTLCASCHLRLHWREDKHRRRVRRMVDCAAMDRLREATTEAMRHLPKATAARLWTALKAVYGGR